MIYLWQMSNFLIQNSAFSIWKRKENLSSVTATKPGSGIERMKGKFTIGSFMMNCNN